MPKEESTDSSGNPSIVGQRSSMIQEFCVAGSDSNCLTVAVNHFKSKGCSGCADDPKDNNGNYTPGIQGCCTNLRTSASVSLGEHLKALSANGKKLLLLGDFNAYGEEDPVYVLTANNINPNENIRVSSVADIPGLPDFSKTQPLTEGYGFINLAKDFHGSYSFSYSYGAELGSLDHAFSNRLLRSQITDISDWHINSLESNTFEYSTDYTGTLPKQTGPYSCSDHDPVIIDMQLITTN